jgi:hypothetical protein
LGESAKCIYTICHALGGRTKLCYFDLKTKKLVNMNLGIPEASRIIQIQSRIFVTGGYKNSSHVKDVTEFIESSKSFVAKSSMINARRSHTLVLITNNCFFVIGGYNGSHMKECEQYDIEKDTWKSLPQLNEAKYGVGCILINKKNLYCFGGYNGSYLKTLEKLEINVAEPRWIIVNLIENQAVDGRMSGLYQVSHNEIVIFRGNDTSDAYLFDIKANTIKKYTKIQPLADYFEEVPYRIGDMIYIIGQQGHIHMFNAKKQEYSSINFSDAK